MKTHRSTPPVTTRPIPGFVAADDIALSPDFNAHAFIVKSDKESLWEKTLVVQFPQRRRVLSTNDGIVDVLVAANHAVHPMFWSAAGRTMTNGDGSRAKVYNSKIHEKIAQWLGVKAEEVVVMGTSADMDNLAVVTKAFAPFVVTALVTRRREGQCHQDQCR